MAGVLRSAAAYFYNFGYRRGAETALRLAPQYESHFDRASVGSAILKIEKDDRCQPIFWPFEVLLDSKGDFAWDSFELGIRDGIGAGLHIVNQSRLEYSKGAQNAK